MNGNIWLSFLPPERAAHLQTTATPEPCGRPQIWTRRFDEFLYEIGGLVEVAAKSEADASE
jgi:hypothetical protein